jgi:hypothetical protein
MRLCVELHSPHRGKICNCDQRAATDDIPRTDDLLAGLIVKRQSQARTLEQFS